MGLISWGVSMSEENGVLLLEQTQALLSSLLDSTEISAERKLEVLREILRVGFLGE